MSREGECGLSNVVDVARGGVLASNVRLYTAGKQVESDTSADEHFHKLIVCRV
jgi:hypothetical protein